MMIRIAKKQAFVSLVNNNPQIFANPNRPKVFVFGLIKPMKLHTRTLRVHLQIKGRGLHGLLLLAGEFGEAIGEGIGNKEIH